MAWVVRRTPHPRYPLSVVNEETGEVAGRYYENSVASAVKHAERLNGAPMPMPMPMPAFGYPEDSGLTTDEAIHRCRQLGEPSEGNGWRRLLWRCADLMEALQRGE